MSLESHCYIIISKIGRLAETISAIITSSDIKVYFDHFA